MNTDPEERPGETEKIQKKSIQDKVIRYRIHRKVAGSFLLDEYFGTLNCLHR